MIDRGVGGNAPPSDAARKSLKREIMKSDDLEAQLSSLEAMLESPIDPPRKGVDTSPTTNRQLHAKLVDLLRLLHKRKTMTYESGEEHNMVEAFLSNLGSPLDSYLTNPQVLDVLGGVDGVERGIGCSIRSFKYRTHARAVSLVSTMIPSTNLPIATFTATCSLFCVGRQRSVTRP